ncbi:hypothetical protein Kpho01_05630 [Kitasatospora phosalacinea]|uniref:Uncharacterized protein n=1 Tax=Kitasatospora phosalacinea TaxID=2065 RepID=A0A9W6PCQ1_9ACTN|nr:hypothetical protein Kpho01_05630 [Kitasatospora phosalacinea]
MQAFGPVAVAGGSGGQTVAQWPTGGGAVGIGGLTWGKGLFKGAPETGARTAPAVR